MHCIKTVNIEREYGNTRIFILASILFFVSFCLSYCLTSYNYLQPHRSEGLLYFLITTVFIYPLHKAFHILPLWIIQKNMVFDVRIKFIFVPVLHTTYTSLIKRNEYLFALLLPTFILNAALLFAAFTWKEYAHYFCLLFAYHCAICMIDLMLARNILKAPRNALIEETEKGYEILVPTW